MKLQGLCFWFLAIGFTFMVSSCNNLPDSSTQTNNPTDSLLFLNHVDSARYVGMQTCKTCHQSIYNTFIETGMGQSFAAASRTKSAADFSGAAFYDAHSDFYYKAGWQRDTLVFTEFRKSKKDTVFKRQVAVNYIVGSGQHTNSHIRSVKGYLQQMPMTYYTQLKKWDLPPGFENGVNTRFDRKIGLECLSCHNAYPKFVTGSENKYESIPQGIDCERCHGPGSIHVNQRMTQSPVDTANAIDYSIVNPAKLPIDRQFDICQRCHLQGNAVLKEGKSFFDYKPGMQLSSVMSVFLPRYKHADDEFIMASHADRLKQSACFIKSLPKAGQTNSLKPYKDALTCITCHNPHVSVRKTNTNVFNDACIGCHTAETISVKHISQSVNAQSNCVSCHMPASGSTDIPHVSVHDHFIRVPLSKKEKQQLKTFIGLASINETKPSALTKAMAYLQQYEKFEQTETYLDSARFYLSQCVTNDAVQRARIQLAYDSKKYQDVVRLVETNGQENLTKTFSSVRIDNANAWTCYRIAESYYTLAQLQPALHWIKQAVAAAPYNLDFRNKYANILALLNQTNAAIKEYQRVLEEHPENVQALVNLGYLSLANGRPDVCFSYYSRALQLDPDYEMLLLNLSGYYLYTGNTAEAKNCLLRLLKRHPENKQARQILKQIG